jgi:hypothetical protein
VRTEESLMGEQSRILNLNGLGGTSCNIMEKIYAHALLFETFRERAQLRNLDRKGDDMKWILQSTETC